MHDAPENPGVQSAVIERFAVERALAPIEFLHWCSNRERENERAALVAPSDDYFQVTLSDFSDAVTIRPRRARGLLYRLKKLMGYM
jgi:hypothetical protein